MANNKKQDPDKQKKKSTDKIVEILHDHNENIKENNTTAINSSLGKNRTELHTKNTVLGSDSDGQAD